MRQGILVITSGPALAGKSTFLGGLKKLIKDFVIVSTDQIRLDDFGSYDFNPANETFVWSKAYAQTEDFLKKGHIVCLDATFRTPEYRGMLLNRFKSFPVIYFAFEKNNIESVVVFVRGHA
jgi:predicted kinase